MLKVLFVTLSFLFLYSCSNKQNPNKPDDKTPFRYYDFNLNIDIINPFIGLESRMLILNAGDEFYDELSDSLYFVQNPKSDIIYFIDYVPNENVRHKKQYKTLGDTAIVQLTKPQLDTIFNMISKVFQFDTINISNDSIPRPPLEHAKIAKVTLDLKFRGDNYSRLVKNTGEKDFKHLYNYLLSKKQSR